MSNEPKIIYLEDQEEMKDGMQPIFDDTEFNVHFCAYTSQDSLTKLIFDLCPVAVIADDDLGGQSYTDEIANAVTDAKKKKKSKILLIGCSAYANASGLESTYKKAGYDRFFDNDGSIEQLEKIIDYVRKNSQK